MMKKFILLVALAATSLVGCDVKDFTPTVFEYPEFAYVVTYSDKMIPADVIAVEVTYLDADGQTKTEKVAKSWFKTVPATKGFKMTMTSKLVWADGKGELTSGEEVDYTISASIRGMINGQPVSGSLAQQRYAVYSKTPNAYKMVNAAIKEAKTGELKYEIQPILEPGMGN